MSFHNTTLSVQSDILDMVIQYLYNHCDVSRGVQVPLFAYTSDHTLNTSQIPCNPMRIVLSDITALVDQIQRTFAFYLQ